MNATVEVKEEKKPVRTAIKLAIVGVILIFLVFLSIGIVKVVPKALNSLATASLSIGSVFGGGTASSTSNATATPSGTAGSTATSTGGFSIRDLTNPHASSTQNWVPAPAGPRHDDDGANHPSRPSTPSTGTHTGTRPTDESGQASNPNYRTTGPSDIAVTVLSKGIISKATGQFVATNNFTTDDMVVIKFKIENRGIYATGPWSARVDMPSSDAADKVRTLGPIGSLYAGNAITGEARFDHPLAGNQNVVIAVDTASATQDTNRASNVVTAPIYVTGSQWNGGSYNPGTAADLQLTILQTGTVDMFGQFTANSYPRIGQKAAARFQVTNVGGATAPAWSWRADLSGSTYNTYSTTEAALAPGQSTRIIVGFDTFNYGASTLTITADSSNQVYEANESNNTGSVTINMNW